MSSAFTNLSSSFRSRFSSRILRLKGRRCAFPPAIWARESSRKIVYCRPATSSVDRLPKEFGCVIFFFLVLGRGIGRLVGAEPLTRRLAANQATSNLTSGGRLVVRTNWGLRGSDQHSIDNQSAIIDAGNP